MQVISGIAKAVDVVRDVNLKVLAPLSLSAETSEGMRELDLTESLVDHGLIGGLGDDDHTHYLLADGTRDITGSIKLTSNNKFLFRDGAQFIQSISAGFLTIEAGTLFAFSINNIVEAVILATGLSITNKLTAAEGVFTIAIGNPPLTITSTDVVANLNVDQVDGKEAAELNPTTTKGDLIGYDTAEARIPVGANGEFLQAQSGEALGVKWAAAAGGGDVTAASTMTDNALVRGDGGAKGVQDSGVLIDDSDNVSGVTTLVVDVAIGTSPLTITSTTVVANLNVDFLDGLHSSAFSLTGHNHILAVGATDVTATFGELNLLDLAGLTAGDVLSADTATTASWKAQTGGSGASLTVSTTEVFSGTSPTSMTNLDLSGTVGAKVALVALSFKSAFDMNAIAVRTDGDTNDYYSTQAEANAYGAQLGHQDDQADLVLIVATSSSGIIEWQTEVALTCTVDIIWFIA